MKCDDTGCGDVDDSELAARIEIEEGQKFAKKLAATQDQIMADADIAKNLASSEMEENMKRMQDVEVDTVVAHRLAASEAQDKNKRIEADAAIARRLAESEDQTVDGEFMPTNGMDERKTTSRFSPHSHKGGDRLFWPFPGLDFSRFFVSQCVVCGEALPLMYAKHPFFTNNCFCPKHSNDGRLCL